MSLPLSHIQTYFLKKGNVISTVLREKRKEIYREKRMQKIENPNTNKNKIDHNKAYFSNIAKAMLEENNAATFSRNTLLKEDEVNYPPPTLTLRGGGFLLHWQII